MIEPSETYDLTCAELNDARANSLIMSFWECKDVSTWNELSQRAYWMLCAFWNGNRSSYDNWHGLINDAVDESIERLSS